MPQAECMTRSANWDQVARGLPRQVRNALVCGANVRYRTSVKRVKLIGGCLVAAFALVAVAAAGSASAVEPEWGAACP